MTLISTHEVNGAVQSVEVEVLVDGIPIEEMPPLTPETVYSFYIDGLLEAFSHPGGFTNLSKTRTDEEIVSLVKDLLTSTDD